MIKSSLAVFLLVAFSYLQGIAQVDRIPEKPVPARLYVDLDGLGFLSPSEEEALEVRLDRFAMETSNQIAVVVVDDLKDMEPYDFATRLGKKWGIGGADDNGVVVLIKPTGGKGQRKLFIAVGRGLEAVIPDLTAKTIVDNELVPRFKNKQFYAGITAALDVLEPLAKGEINKSQYGKRLAKKKNQQLIILGIIAVILLVVFLGLRKSKSARTYGGAYGQRRDSGFGGFWWFGGGGFGGGNSGGGSSGGGFGGFDGFGGGDFGGGGAGGDW